MKIQKSIRISPGAQKILDARDREKYDNESVYIEHLILEGEETKKIMGAIENSRLEISKELEQVKKSLEQKDDSKQENPELPDYNLPLSLV